MSIVRSAWWQRARNALISVSPTHRFTGFQKEIQFEVLRCLRQTPGLSQRRLGVSPGGISDQLRLSLEKSWIEMRRFGQRECKLRYAYLLVLAGVAEKSKSIVEFPRRRMPDYEALQQEVEALKADLNSETGDSQ
ncbi:protein of unknown function [Burkholderia multivorans]